MEKKYLMIDSTYRDRLLYPNPAEFILPINVSRGNTIFNSKNPLMDGYPIHSFCFLDASGSFSGTIIGGNPSALRVDDTIDALTGLNNPLIGTTLDEATNMFINLVLTVAGDANTYAIVAYDPVRHIITTDTPVIGFTLGGTYTIINDSTPQSIVLQGYQLSLSGVAVNNNGFFISDNKPLYVWDMTINEVRTGFLNEKTIELDEAFSGAWAIDDKLSVSYSCPPLEIGEYDAIIPNIFYLRSGLWRYDLIDAGNGYTNGTEFNIVVEQETRPIYALAIGRVALTTTHGAISRIELLYCGDGYTLNAEYYLLPIGEPFREGLARVKVLSTAIGFMIESTHPKSALVGSYFMPLLLTPEFVISPSDSLSILISPNNSFPPSPNRILSNITMMEGNSFNGVTPIVDVFVYEGKTIILTQPLDMSLYARFQCTNLAAFPEAFNYQILPFRGDGCISMDYRGTTVSSNQMVCYALTVNTLILPNQILNLPYGALTSSYPYVLLEITNETASSGHNKSVIYSNNPNTVSATFVCSISDVNSPIITKFINISSDRATQVIKFKPNDNLKFRISMPDGRTFETETKDYLPPLQPNPLLQLNCLIEIIRL
jgi:hypothetical protein